MGKLLARRLAAALAAGHATIGAAAVALLVSSASADLIAQWDFNDETLSPSAGAGVLATVGGVSGESFAQASGSSDPFQPGFGWQTSAYPAQGADSGTAGIEFRVSSVGYESLAVSWDQRLSNTASRWAEFHCSVDGGLTFAVLQTFQFAGGGVWFNDQTVDLSSVAGASNNPLLIFRIVSIFSPGSLEYAAAEPGSSYGGGTWRFDMITVEGVASSVPAPGAAALLGLAALAGRRRRH